MHACLFGATYDRDVWWSLGCGRWIISSGAFTRLPKELQTYKLRAVLPPTMATFVPPVTLYDLLLEAIQFGSDEEAYQAVSEALSRPPAQASKALRTLSHILPDVIRLRKNHLLQYLLQNGVTVIAAAVKMAAGLLYESAKYYLELLFAHGWDINRALSNTEPPVLRYVILT